MSHTPGPWGAIPKDWIVTNSKGEMFVDVLSTSEYDVHLIAAAPDLLAALEDVLDRIGALSNRSELDSLMEKQDADRVFATLAKAKGKA